MNTTAIDITKSPSSSEAVEALAILNEYCKTHPETQILLTGEFVYYDSGGDTRHYYKYHIAEPAPPLRKGQQGETQRAAGHED